MNLVRMNFIANMELQYCGVSQCTFLLFYKGYCSRLSQSGSGCEPAAERRQAVGRPRPLLPWTPMAEETRDTPLAVRSASELPAAVEVGAASGLPHTDGTDGGVGIGGGADGDAGGGSAAAGAAAAAGVHTVCIGDLHGQLDAFQKLWGRIEAHLGAEVLAAAAVVFLGDYVDRGPQSNGVLEALIKLRDQRRRQQTPEGSEGAPP